jgi:hypothetical protein
MLKGVLKPIDRIKHPDREGLKYPLTYIAMKSLTP